MLRRIRIMIMNHLGFSLREANGTLVLIIILSIFIFIPPLYSSFASAERAKFESNPKDILEWKNEFRIVEKNTSDNENLSKINLEGFDPNLISKEKWVEYGIKASIADRIINYRNAGGTFRKSTDLYKIYGIDSGTAELLIPFVRIKPKASTPKKPKGVSEESVVTETIHEKLKLDINLATQQDFKQIYGIGEKLSSRILSYRSSLGGYHSLSQLSEVYYLQDSLLPKIDERFFFGGEQVELLFVNSDSMQRLKRHPYLTYNQAKAIVNYRGVHGNFTAPEDLLAIKIINDSTFQKLKPYISVKE